MKRQVRESNAKIEAVRNALIEGERSGEPQPFGFAAFVRCKRTQWAELNRRLDAYELDRDPGRPAEAVLHDIRKRLRALHD